MAYRRSSAAASGKTNLYVTGRGIYLALFLMNLLDIPLPDSEGRRELLRINLKSIKVAEDVNLDELSKQLKGYSGADITNVSMLEGNRVTYEIFA